MQDLPARHTTLQSSWEIRVDTRASLGSCFRRWKWAIDLRKLLRFNYVI